MNLIFSNLLISKSSPQIKVPIFVERRSKCVGCWAAAGWLHDFNARSLARSTPLATANETKRNKNPYFRHDRSRSHLTPSDFFN